MARGLQGRGCQYISTDVSDTWLNDAVKGYLSPRGAFDRFLDLPHLKVFVAQLRYLLAMKCAAMRLGEEFHDVDDVRYLLRHLNISRVEEALAIITQYFDESQFMPKTRLVLEELVLDPAHVHRETDGRAGASPVIPRSAPAGTIT